MKIRKYKDTNVRVKAVSLNGIRAIFYAFSLLLAGLCLMRVLAVPANAATVDEIEETYEGSETKHDSADDENSEEYGRIDVRLSSADEADQRIDESEGYALVPGAERIISMNRTEDLENATVTHSDTGSRAIASVRDKAHHAKPAVRNVPAAKVQKKYLSNEDVEGLIVPAKPTQRFQAEPTPGKEIQVPATQYSTNNEFLLNEEPRAVKPGMYQEVSVIVSDYGYFPSRVFVTQNIPVKMYLTTPSKSTLCMMIDPWGVKKGIQPGKVEEVSFVPDSPGNFRFYCPVKGIEGTITVRSAPIPGESGRNVASDEYAEGDGAHGDAGRTVASSSRGGKFSDEEKRIVTSKNYLKEEASRGRVLKTLEDDE